MHPRTRQGQLTGFWSGEGERTPGHPRTLARAADRLGGERAKQTDRHRLLPSKIHRHRPRHTGTDRQTGRETHTDRQADGQTVTQTGRHREKRAFGPPLHPARAVDRLSGREETSTYRHR